MKMNSLRRWSRPKVILLITTVTESPTHTLRVVSEMRTVGSRLFLVQLPATTQIIYPPDRNVPFLLSAAPQTFQRHSGDDTGQAFLWAEILSEVTVLKNTPIERIPVLVDSLAADMVVLTTPEIGRLPFRGGNNTEIDLFGSLAVPILILGARMRKMTSSNGREIQKILVPVSFGPDLDRQMRFACRFARRHHGRLTVLHVFENQASNIHAWERTPLAVEEKIPISELRREGIMCPMEVAISEGYPERKILLFNERKPHDLIIMGGPRRRNSLQASRQSVTEAVIAEAQCPVLILGTAIMSTPSNVAESSSELSLA